jgi:hypothetical protein
LDSRLSFVGFVGALRQARTTFTVPPLEPGTYAVAYWCRDCHPRGRAVGLAAAPKLRVDAPVGEACPINTPNGRRLPGAPALDVWTYHGNGAIAALLPRNGILVTNAAGGLKMPWVARDGLGTGFSVQYRTYQSSVPARVAQAVPGTLTGYDGPSWASRLSLEPGCWQITARLSDVSLSFVVQVERGQG